MNLVAPFQYDATIAGQSVGLPLIELTPSRAIALLMVIDMGVHFGEMVGAAIAERVRDLAPEIIVGSATLGIPVAIEVSRRLGLDHYVILQKSPKFHLADAMTEEVHSVTTAEAQKLLLDRRQIARLEGRRVIVVDDVIATGSSMAASMRLVRRAGANILQSCAILTEGRRWQKALGPDAALVSSLGHIPQFEIRNGVATPDPDSLMEGDS